MMMMMMMTMMMMMMTMMMMMMIIIFIINLKFFNFKNKRLRRLVYCIKRGHHLAGIWQETTYARGGFLCGVASMQTKKDSLHVHTYVTLKTAFSNFYTTTFQ